MSRRVSLLRARRDLAADLVWGLTIGLACAAICIVMLGALVLGAGKRPGADEPGIPLLIAGYLAMAIAAGGTLGLVRPWLSLTWGRWLATFVCVVIILAIALAIVEEQPSGGAFFVKVVVSSLFITPAVRLGLWVVDRLVPD